MFSSSQLEFLIINSCSESLGILNTAGSKEVTSKFALANVFLKLLKYCLSESNFLLIKSLNNSKKSESEYYLSIYSQA